MSAAARVAERPRTAAAATDAPAAGSVVLEHFRRLHRAVECLTRHADHLEAWGVDLAARLRTGSRLLVAGNGGSAAEAQHLAAELVGRYSAERDAFSAIALNAETSSLTAIGNDYGFAEVFARQISAHGRAGDIVLLISTSGRSRNLLEAARAAARVGATTWALTGEGPNPLTTVCDDAVCIDGDAPQVQECQLAAIHAMCEVFDSRVLARRRADA